jgi:hypothetical protein
MMSDIMSIPSSAYRSNTVSSTMGQTTLDS